MASFPLGKYKEYNSLIHKIDARVKLFSMILLMVLIFFRLENQLMDFTFYGLLFIFVLVIMKIAHIKIKALFNTIKPMWFMMIFLFIINLFAIKSGDFIVLFEGTNFAFTLYLDAIYNTLYTFLRIILMLAFSLILTSTTRPMDLTYALEWYLTPLKLIKIPIHIIVMIISLALRFIPTLLEETDRIMKAQASRGVDFENGKFLEKVRAIISLIIPLFISAIQRSSELADAMEVRGYNPEGKRTRYRVMKIRFRDVMTLLFMIAILAGIILLIHFNINIFVWVN